MAEMQETRRAAEVGQATPISKVTNFLGAAVSLALLVGVGMWSYQLLMRDVSGVPVVRAAAGPMREQPREPGGEQARHQGLSVNDVAAVGTAGAPADQISLAPAPLGLTDDDAALPSVGQSIPQRRESGRDAPADEPQPDVALDAADLKIAAVEQLAARLASGVAPLQELAPLGDAVPATQEEVQAAVAGATGITPDVVDSADVDVSEAVDQAVQLAMATGGLGRSLRPKQRPAQPNAQPGGETVASAALVPAGVTDVDPDSIAPGTRLAQLGAYDTADVARAEWDRLNARFGDYLQGKSRVVQQASSGGRTFFRLRVAGFADLSDARRFCSALVAEKADCIPVVTR